MRVLFRTRRALSTPSPVETAPGIASKINEKTDEHFIHTATSVTESHDVFSLRALLSCYGVTLDFSH